MCGITGILDITKDSTDNILQEMADTLAHRGPDGGKQVSFQTDEVWVGLGHRRLSVIDIGECGDQPMCFSPLWICFNGEIYNYLSVKEDLLKLGHKFQSNSDTEVILHAYSQWGNTCLSHFRGMFAFIILNQENGEVFCARDRAGVKPFYFYLQDGLFLFGSELKALHKHPRFCKKINHTAIEMYMQFGNIPAPHAIFQSTFKLKPGHFLEFNLKDLKNKPIELEQHQYWNVYDAYNQSKLDISFSEAINTTESILREAFELRMISDVPIGVFLSGGYDSASVVALLQKDRTKKLKTFTISVPEISINEAPFAKRVADYLDTDHTEIECTVQEALDLINDLPYYYDEPFGDSSAIPTSLVAKTARRKVTVALSADGGDEVFAGYNRYDYLLRYASTLNRIPRFVRNLASSVMDIVPANRIVYFNRKYNFPTRYEKAKRLLRNPSDEELMWSLSKEFTSAEISNLLIHRSTIPFLSYNSKELKKDFYTPLSYLMAIDYQTYLPDDIMTKVDRATMQFGLEGREPFLDQKVIEWAARLPDDFKYHKGIKKYILREIVHQYIPKELMDRPKSGFAIPIRDWMSNKLKGHVETYLNKERIQGQDIFNWEAVNALKVSFYNGRKELYIKLWYLLMFQMWYDKWMK